MYNNMNRKYLRIAFAAMAAPFLLASCSQEDTLGGDRLPEGAYPLEIASVTMEVEGSEQPWTRVAEDKNDGNSSVWEWNGKEKIGVQIGNGKPGTYVLSEGKTITAENACYWASTATGQTVKAWFPATDESISLADQSAGLAYVLQATETADFNTTVTLGFDHQLAKVRVVLSGTQAAQAENVEVKGYTSCTHTQGAVTVGDTQDWLKMKHTTYDDGIECWEANVVPGTITLSDFIRLNGTNVVTNLKGIPETLEGGNMYTVDLTVGEPIIDITSENCNNINGDGNYRVKGSFEETITVTGGSPTIYLESANINVGNGPAINITSGTPTIHVTGENTIETSKSLSNRSAGIYVAKGSSITIEGSGTDDVLRVTGGADGAAIGGYYDSGDKSCGNIVIKNVTLHAYAVDNYMFAYTPGIGATGGTCGRIEISSSTIYARSFGDATYSAPAIGAYGSVPEIVITNSEIHAYRGSYGTSYADYIGRGGSMMDYQGGQIQYGSGSITGSTIYKYTYNALTGSSSSDGIETY